MIPNCPNCGVALPKVPKRGSTCKACGKEFAVRSKTKLFSRTVLTLKEALASDTFANLELLGARREQYEALARDGRSPTDAIWGLWHKLMSEDPSIAESQYYSMALFLAREGRDSRHVLRAHKETELLRYKATGLLRGVKISSAGPASCPACQAQGGRFFTLDEALRQMPLPHPDCTHVLGNSPHGFCRCAYLPQA